MTREEFKAFVQSTALLDAYRTLHRKCLHAMSKETVGDFLAECQKVMADENEHMADRLLYGLALTGALQIMCDELNEAQP